jgi:hypothetical protein
VNLPDWLGGTIGLGADAIISSVGAAVCVTVPHIHVWFIDGGGRVGIGWHYGESPDIFLADNCDTARYRANVAHLRVAANGARTFQIAKGTLSFNVRLEGQSDEPRVALSGPNGEHFSTSEHKLGKRNMLIWGFPGTRRTYVGIRHPAPGKWTITPEVGSTPITKVATALGHPPAKISATVSGKGRERTLHYRVRPRSGQQVTFVEHSRDVDHVIGTATGKTGTIRFTPADGPAGKRAIVARIRLDGVPIQNLTVGHYRAPGPLVPGAPQLRVARKRSSVVIHWSAAPGVRSWSVVVAERGGRKHVFALRATKQSLKVKVAASQSGVVSVRGIGAQNVIGKRARAKFKAKGRAKSRFAAPLDIKKLRKATHG